MAESTQADFVGKEAPIGDDDDDFKDVGTTAVWMLSGAKPGNGVDQLLDGDVSTYWQSDGVAPHYINVQFPRKTSLKQVSLYLDYALDESYTPKKLCIRAGSSTHDLRDIMTIHLHEPAGWINVPLGDPAGLGANRYLRCHLFQVCVLAMHQNGRDTHVRQVKVFGPKEVTAVTVQHPELTFPEFTTVELSQYSTIR